MAESARRAATSTSTKSSANEGEGNKTAARRYNEAVRATVRTGKVTEKAREAAKALDGPEGAELRRAEAEGKKPASSSKKRG